MNTFADTILKAPPRRVFASRADVVVVPDAVLFYGEREERSQIAGNWAAQFSHGFVREISEGAVIGQAFDKVYSQEPIMLRDRNALVLWASTFNGRPVYVDITGLGHQVWMPLVKVLIETAFQVYCIYSEPEKYTINPNPRPGEFYHLSDRVREFIPIPTMARIPSRRSSSSILLPLLGFEGPRFRHLIEKLEPSERDVSPIIGVPGFEIDYPFHTYEGNAEVLSTSRSWQRVRYVDAACPFALFEAIQTIRRAAPDRLLQLAAIGTKPHALGALLFAISDGNCEILHDHPIRKLNRTSGASKCHVYDVTAFLRDGQ